MAIVADILINRPSKHLDRTFSYRVPDQFSYITSGWRCVVPFAGRMEEGIVLSISTVDTEKLTYTLRDVTALIDDYAWFTPEMLALGRWISLYYLCTYIDALRLFLIDKKGIRTHAVYTVHWASIPDEHLIRGLLDESVERLSEEDAALIFGKELADYTKKGYILREETAESIYRVPLEKWLGPADIGPSDSLRKKGKKQALLWDDLQESGARPVKELADKGFSSALIRSFCKNGLGTLFYREKDTYSLIQKTKADSMRVLTPEQEQALTQIQAGIDEKKGEGFLLMGVTGSGKTEVYLRGTDYARSLGGSVLILVPEIALTNQMVDYFSARFGDDVVFIHSKLSKGERYNNRMRVKNGKSHIVIGSRSALFMPFSDLSLIIVDEEYDSSYKQDETPFYNGRDAAKKLAFLHHCPIVLGAATPSIGTYAAAKAGQIGLIEMKERVHHTPLPKIHIVDMKLESNMAEESIFSRTLLVSLQRTLAAGNKAILFLNRRGYSTSLICQDCGYVFKCPNCDVSLVYHKEAQKLKCHYCECVFPLPRRCPECGGIHISYTGRGTEKAEEQLQAILPEARCVRLDLDSTSRKHGAADILSAFRAGTYNVLLGTQMVTKGHDIPGVQMVGILTADNIMNMPTYLAAEQAYTLITQCAGRAGRGLTQGEVILQTYDPAHYVVQAAIRQDYVNFYNQEIRFREALHYPPFVRMMKITCFSKEYKAARERADSISTWLSQTLPRLSAHIEATPPYDEPIRKVRNTYYVSITIKGDSLIDLKTAMREAKVFKQNGIIIDVDPMF